MNRPRGGAIMEQTEARSRRHTLDLGPSEAVAVADVDRDGRLDIVCGENWYQQGPPEPDKALRFVKHKFRDLAHTDFYLEELSDLD